MQEPLFKLALDETAPTPGARLGISPDRYKEIFEHTVSLLDDLSEDSWLKLANKALVPCRNLNEAYVALEVLSTARVLDRQPHVLEVAIAPIRKVLRFQRRIGLVCVMLSNVICNICWVLTGNGIAGIGAVVTVLFMIIATYLFERNMKAVLANKPQRHL